MSKFASQTIVIAILIAVWTCSHVEAQEPATPREWALAQVPQELPPPALECYQVRWQPGKWQRMCITEAQWLRIHHQELLDAHRAARDLYE